MLGVDFDGLNIQDQSSSQLVNEEDAMVKLKNLLLVSLALLFVGCMEKKESSSQQLGDKMIRNWTVIGDHKLKAISKFYEAKKSYMSCEKLSKNPELQCMEAKIEMMLEGSEVCSLTAKMDFISIILDHDGKTNGDHLKFEVDCDLDDRPLNE